jgi:hypothetical protein
VELILSQELGPLRLYAGGEYLFRRSPRTLDPYVAHGGAELRVVATRSVRLVASGDVKASEQQDWDPAVSARAGVEFLVFSSSGHPPRLWSILAEAYDGPSPYGQFYLQEIRFLGAGLHFQL